MEDYKLARYHMKRKEKEITDDREILDIIKKGRFTSISMSKENEPYIIALSYGYDQSKNVLYFHCATEGQKIDFIKSNPHVCGTIIEDKGYQEGGVQAFKSVVYRGKIAIITEIEEKKHSLEILIDHLEKNPRETKKKLLTSEDVSIKPAILRLDITEITCKEEKAAS
jgi:nitroimidazol reductase NimA-like FMN-containing flavoprotein (pyridoxamine 5'-phosphate oxidase superfamily)